MFNLSPKNHQLAARPYLSLEKLSLFEVWHKRFGHVAVSIITIMAKSNKADGLIISNAPSKSNFFEGCFFGKNRRLRFPSKGKRRIKNIWWTHTDFCETMSVLSIAGARYFAIFKDDFSGFSSIYFLKQKSEVIFIIMEVV